MSTDISIPQTGREVRRLIRAGLFRQPTSGVAPHHVQANVAILPKEMAFEFLLFCQRNPKPCPVIEVIESGEVEASLTATGSDITKDVPLYRVYKHGKMVDEPETLESYWRDDLVTFLLGCSFSFEHALMANGIDLPYYGTKRNVPMFITNIETEKSGPFAGPMVVSHRWIPQNKLVRAVQATSRFPETHGAPVHIGDPEKIGISDIRQPDFGEVWERKADDEVPVFWACGVTPQSIAMASKPELMITHSPGHMFVTDLKDEDLAVI
ncbi:MAG: putative hydro-lyase [SAR202 cluster bacterium]|nr:putative hydro-lyase [SAR202 cluster bacterium]|tara:strand:+ start:1030 stop:1830 length:801 start_codon:yes stop_codon:yes gene_type:complete